MTRILVTQRIFEDGLARLRGLGELRDNQDDARWTPEDWAARLADADAILVAPRDRFDATLLGQARHAKVLAAVSVGYNHIDVEACTARGILVTNTPDVLTESTADHAWALLLAAARRVAESDRWTRAGHWRGTRFDDWMGADVHGTVLGIVGMGRIGRAIARRAQGFGMRVLYHNRRALPADEAAGAQWCDKDTLLATADHVVLVVPYAPSTHHLIGAAELARMKPTATLVNVARGGVVDDAALIAALEAGRLAAAGLDVYENEPALDPGFARLDNAVLTPHIASATRATRAAMMHRAIDNLAAALGGERPRDLVNPQVWQAGG